MLCFSRLSNVLTPIFKSCQYGGGIERGGRAPTSEYRTASTAFCAASSTGGVGAAGFSNGWTAPPSLSWPFSTCGSERLMSEVSRGVVILEVRQPRQRQWIEKCEGLRQPRIEKGEQGTRCNETNEGHPEDGRNFEKNVPRVLASSTRILKRKLASYVGTAGDVIRRVRRIGAELIEQDDQGEWSSI